ncbi:MAG TPA: helix-turn-helix domain-containing protein [Patescibacteria group bacterium]|nr:helix-turn-helix domain-containing protein [Patescibacteria group bacterium]
MSLFALKYLGLNDKQIALYSAVLRAGKTPVTQLAKLAGVNRSSAYYLLKELDQLGLIERDLAGRVEYVTAKSPEELKYVLERKETEFYKNKKAVEESIRELESIQNNQSYAPPKITYVEEQNLERFLYKRTASWNQSVLQHDNHWWGYQDKTFINYFEKWIDWYWETGSPPSIELKLLSNQSAENIKKKKFARRQIQFWKKTGEFKATTWIAGDYVIMIITSTRPFYAIEIYDRILANEQRQLFKGIWETLDEAQ